MTWNMDGSIEVIDELDLSTIEPGARKRFAIPLVNDGLGMPIYVPVMVAKGHEDGPTLAVTAAVHGNELNGIPVVQRVFKEVASENIRGTLIGIPVVNVPGLQMMQRKFNDGEDLNRIMPGKERGNTSDMYAYRLVTRILNVVDYLVDLHTASFGRINSYYIRANMQDKENAQLARLQNAQIIVDSPAPDSTLRGYLGTQGKKAITLEVGDPSRFQKGLIRSGLTGIFNTLSYLNMMDGEVEDPEGEPYVCSHSYWQYTDEGGFLEVHPQVTELVKKGQVIATVRNIYGDLIKQHRAYEDGVVIGKSTNPVAQTGSRLLHLGILK